MKRLLLGITLLTIIFIAVLCKPTDDTFEEDLLQREKVEIVAEQKQPIVNQEY